MVQIHVRAQNMTIQLPNNKPCPHCGRYDNRPNSVDALIIKDDSILLIKRGMDPSKGLWATPGGHVDWDETVEQSVIREVKEEAGLDVTELKLLGVYSNPSRHPKQVIASAFICKVTGIVKAGDDAVDAQWFPLHKLPKPLAFDHGKMIEDYVTQFSLNIKK
jgi:8-oxo-dGTP diphosphatase